MTVAAADMRAWEAPVKADVLVSELLGSFGDNELSPECLDGAQRFLKEGGISIPQSYRSYLAPSKGVGRRGVFSGAQRSARVCNWCVKLFHAWCLKLTFFRNARITLVRNRGVYAGFHKPVKRL